MRSLNLPFLIRSAYISCHTQRNNVNNELQQQNDRLKITINALNTHFPGMWSSFMHNDHQPHCEQRTNAKSSCKHNIQKCHQQFPHQNPLRKSTERLPFSNWFHFVCKSKIIDSIARRVEVVIEIASAASIYKQHTIKCEREREREMIMLLMRKFAVLSAQSADGSTQSKYESSIYYILHLCAIEQR